MARTAVEKIGKYVYNPSMIELTLTSLLMFMGGNFCEYAKEGHDDYKSLLMAYSDASAEYGVEEVKKVIEKSGDIKLQAKAVILLKCPQVILK